MRMEVYKVIKSNPELHQFLRAHPIWYRKLGRDPATYSEMIRQSNIYYGRTFPQRIERVQKGMTLAAMMLEMMSQTKEA